MTDPLPQTMALSTPRPKLVLVVEDETLIRMAVAECLRQAGYRVLEAAGVEEAISLLGAYNDIAALFTDIQMPGPLNGAALTRLARMHHPDVTVIATSGAPVPPGMDVDDFMPKPYPPSDVAQRLNELLS